MSKPWLLPASHEDSFLDRYDQLLHAALHLTGQDRDRAEDLLHTVFVQFTLARPDLSAIRNLDDYLFISLRNTQVSHARRQAAFESNELFVADYDSAEVRLRESSPAARLLVEDQLWTVCKWACERKATVKDASVLILRFFHGYYPREIAMVANMSPGAVDKAMQSARESVRIYMAQPAVANNPVGCSHRLDSREDFLAGAQAHILASRESPCLPEDILRTLYKPASEPLTCGVLAHLVSCRNCLDRAGRILGLGYLADRHPNDTLGPQGPRASGGGLVDPASQNAKERFAQKSRRLRSLTVTHRPKTLFASVNGLVLCSHTTQGNSNKFTLRIPANERVSFVEIHSEQGVHLLLLSTQPPPEGELQQETTVWLGDETPPRTLTARMDFTGVSASLEVIYRDPHPEVPPQPTTVERCAAVPEFSTIGRWRGMSRIWELIRLRPWQASLTSAVAIATIVALVWTQTAALSAAVLVQRSAQRERSAISQPGRAVHRVINLEERRLPGGRVMARRRIDVWASRQIAVRTYDEDGNLATGEWGANDGRRLLYRRGRKPIAAPSDPDADTLGTLSVDEVASRPPPSAVGYERLLGGELSSATVSRLKGDFHINYVGSGRSDSSLRSASLVLDGQTLGFREETVVIGSANGEREFHFIETKRESAAIGAISPSVFSPDAALLPPTAEIADGKSAATTRMPTSPGTGSELSGTIFGVISALDGVQALLGEQIEIRRTPEGVLRVEGLVEQEWRLQVILAALKPLMGDQSVDVALKTLDTAVIHSRPPRRVVKKEFAVTSRTTDAEVDLERYFAQRGIDASGLSDEIGRFREQVQNGARDARRHARALVQIVQWLHPVDLTASQVERWKEMIRMHVAVCLRSAAEIDRLAAPVFAVTTLPNRQNVSEGSSENIVRRLSDRAMEVDQSLLSALSLSVDGHPNRSLRDVAFWRSLGELQDLARELEERTRN